ncbi:glutamyl-tRNA reductase [Faecalibacter macacae]|uniref:Glutamyl-tRNA reductase n=1 Tax=Faecalibacter macacae TaxID=1859289 RepID=A0A3L9MHI0_9FLAO|nr:glutamyl-tRNA reductase [Faecalibacter macacae]RLZ12298.1 glutamyl-tRNA reductase [Faecalibacter macacae]
MTIRGNKEEQKFYVIGISYEKADAVTRGKYTFFPEQVEAFTKDSQANGLDNFFVVSTCNRTEFYGFADSEDQMVEQYCKFTEGNANEFRQFMMVKEGEEAISHLFRVSSGLESQILGDFDIIGQIKIWFVRFKKMGASNAFLERLVNTAIQISKKVKNETFLSNGSASVAYSAVNFIQQTQPDLTDKNILLYGIGKIGRNTCANLVKQYPTTNITLINRTKAKAEAIALKHHVKVKDHSELQEELKNTDILIVATGASVHTITEDMIPYDKQLTIIDMSVPENVVHTLASRESIQLVNVDGLSKMVDDTIAQRRNAVPEAIAIIDEYSKDFYEWLENREFVPAIQLFKNRLDFLQQHELNNLRKDNIEVSEQEIMLTNKLMQKITNQFASFLIENRDDSKETIELIEKMFHLKQA